MNRPSPEALRHAAEWLDCYEGKSPDCVLTAAWLREQADAVELRRECRSKGVPVGAARRAIAKAGAA